MILTPSLRQNTSGDRVRKGVRGTVDPSLFQSSSGTSIRSTIDPGRVTNRTPPWPRNEKPGRLARAISRS